MTGRIRQRRGQALMELAVGMFTIALLTSALVTFALYIVRGLEIQNHLRGQGHGIADKIELDSFAEENIFGVHNLHIREPLGNMDRIIP